MASPGPLIRGALVCAPWPSTYRPSSPPYSRPWNLHLFSVFSAVSFSPLFLFNIAANSTISVPLQRWPSGHSGMGRYNAPPQRTTFAFSVEGIRANVESGCLIGLQSIPVSALWVPVAFKRIKNLFSGGPLLWLHVWEA